MLTPRWTQLRYHAVQNRYWKSVARYCATWAGRRSGKTEIGKRRLVRKAMTCTRPNGWFVAGGPTYGQAKKIFWDDLKALVPKEFRSGQVSESSLSIPLINGAQIQVVGLDKPERIEGNPLDHILITEFANVKPDAWFANIRPALSTPGRPGTADIESVPEGRNHFWRLCMKARALEKQNPGRWQTFHWKSAEILDPEEIEAAKNELDDLTFRQEYEAEFVTFSGTAYYDWRSDVHVRPIKYEPSLPLIVCHDFNVEPGVAVICQEQVLPAWKSEDGKYVYDGTEVLTCVIAEVHIPRNSNTVIVCDKVVSLFRDHPGEVYVYGDATGGARKSSATAGSDWDLVKQVYRGAWPNRMKMRVPDSNPPERYRLNAVNARLRSISGQCRVIVDPRCRHLIEDFEGVTLIEGGSGEIDKKADESLTHMTDAFGYYIFRSWPIGGRSKMEVTTF